MGEGMRGEGRSRSIVQNTRTVVWREREGKRKGKKGRGIDVHIHFDELNELLTVRNFNFGLVEIVFCAIEPGDTCIHTVLPTN